MTANTTLAAIVAEWVGAVMIFMMAWVLWRSHRQQAFDLSALICDPETHQVMFYKFSALLCLLATTWIVIYLAVDKSLTDNTFGAYVLAWGAVKVAGDITQNQKIAATAAAAKDAPPTTKVKIESETTGAQP